MVSQRRWRHLSSHLYRFIQCLMSLYTPMLGVLMRFTDHSDLIFVSAISGSDIWSEIQNIFNSTVSIIDFLATSLPGQLTLACLWSMSLTATLLALLQILLVKTFVGLAIEMVVLRPHPMLGKSLCRHRHLRLQLMTMKISLLKRLLLFTLRPAMVPISKHGNTVALWKHE